MEKDKTSVHSVMLSCTRNIAIAIAVIYLLYLLTGVIGDNWDAISNRISSFFLLFEPFKVFMFEHLGKIFISWLVLSIWAFCVMSKLDMNEMVYPRFLDVFVFLLIPAGSLILFMAGSFLDFFILSGLSFFAGFVLLIFFIVVCCSLIFPDDETTEKDKENIPEQLKLFDDKE